MTLPTDCKYEGNRLRAGDDVLLTSGMRFVPLLASWPRASPPNARVAPLPHPILLWFCSQVLEDWWWRADPPDLQH